MNVDQMIEKYRIVGWEHYGVGSDIDTYSKYYSKRVESNNHQYITLFGKQYKVGEVIDKKLIDSLYCQIPLFLYKDEHGTIGSTDELKKQFSILMEDLKQINAYTATNADENVRLANIVIAWNYFQHFYPYFDEVDVDWEKVLVLTLKEVLQNQTRDDFIASLEKMLSYLQDGHIFVEVPWSKKTYFLPFRIDWIEDEIVVTNTLQPELVQRGDIILEINGKNAKEIVHEQESFISGSPQFKRYLALIKMICGTKDGSVNLTINRDGEQLNITTSYSEKDLIERYDLPQGILEVTEGIYYINLVTTSWSEFEKRLGELNNVKGFIFDVRYVAIDYSSEFILPKYFPLLIAQHGRQTMISPIYEIPQVVYPDQQNVTYKKEQWSGEPYSPRIQPLSIFITDEGMLSAIENTLSFVKHYKLGKIVGQPTAGANGVVNRFSLFGDIDPFKGYIIVRWTGDKVRNQDGSQHHRIGIQPDYVVERTLQAVREGRDEFIEKAIEV